MLIYLKPDRTESKLNLWFDYNRSKKWHTWGIWKFEEKKQKIKDILKAHFRKEQNSMIKNNNNE